MTETKYLIENRLSEVISLIVALARSEKTFRSNKGLDGSFRTGATSAGSWIDVAKDHPEFFRLGRDHNSVALLIRFLDRADVTEGDIRPTLAIEETQKLVDQAIELHDKQHARSQKRNYLIPLYCAILSALVAITIAIVGSVNNGKITNQIEVLTSKIDSLQKSK